jgi:hypothetical protein
MFIYYILYLYCLQKKLRVIKVIYKYLVYKYKGCHIPE